MKFITIRDLRQGTAGLANLLKKSKKLVLTSNGKPLAILVRADEETLEDDLIALRRQRALSSLERIGRQAQAAGLDQLSMKEIDRIISQVRKERKSDAGNR